MNTQIHNFPQKVAQYVSNIVSFPQVKAPGTFMHNDCPVYCCIVLKYNRWDFDVCPSVGCGFVSVCIAIVILMLLTCLRILVSFAVRMFIHIVEPVYGDHL